MTTMEDRRRLLEGQFLPKYSELISGYTDMVLFLGSRYEASKQVGGVVVLENEEVKMIVNLSIEYHNFVEDLKGLFSDFTNQLLGEIDLHKSEVCGQISRYEEELGVYNMQLKYLNRIKYLEQKLTKYQEHFIREGLNIY
jgi:hypothetical protein